MADMVKIAEIAKQLGVDLKSADRTQDGSFHGQAAEGVAM